MKRLIVLFTIVPFLSFGDSFAQANQGGFSLLVNIHTPVDKFRGNSGINTGLGFGIEYTYPIDAPGLSWVTSASLLLNGIDNSDDVNELIKTMYRQIAKGRYYNIPILTGFKFHGLVPRTISGYGIAQIGLNFYKPPNRSGKTVESFSDFAISFGIGIGGGLVFYNKYNVGIRIYHFREAKIKVKQEYDGIRETWTGIRAPESMLLVTFGIKL